MLVSHAHKFIFTKTVKTASTSVEFLFEPYCLIENHQELLHSGKELISSTGIVGARGLAAQEATWYNHMPLKEIHELLDESIFKRYFKFTTIRNPYSKMVSLFYYLEKRNKKRLKKGLEPQDLRINNNIESDVLRFRNWLYNGGLILDRSKYFLNGALGVDFFIRYEHLFSDLKTVCNKLDISTDILKNLKHQKPGVNKKPIPTEEYYDTHSRKLIEKKYDWEINYFGYNLD